MCSSNQREITQFIPEYLNKCMQGQITFTQKAIKQQIKLNFIKVIFSLYKREQLKNMFMYKQSINVLYICKYINNSLTPRTENHWKYFILLGIILQKNCWTWHRSSILDQLNVEFQINQDIQSCMIFFIYQNTNNLYFTKCTKYWAIYFFQWKNKNLKSKEKKN